VGVTQSLCNLPGKGALHTALCNSCHRVLQCNVASVMAKHIMEEHSESEQVIVTSSTKCLVSVHTTCLVKSSRSPQAMFVFQIILFPILCTRKNKLWWVFFLLLFVCLFVLHFSVSCKSLQGTSLLGLSNPLARELILATPLLDQAEPDLTLGHATKTLPSIASSTC